MSQLNPVLSSLFTKIFSVIAIVAMSLGTLAPPTNTEEAAESIEARLVRQYNAGFKKANLEPEDASIISPETIRYILPKRDQIISICNPAKLFILFKSLIFYH